MGRYFGTDGFRGEVGKDLTADHAFYIGCFLGMYFRSDRRPRFLIGKDTRLSSDTLEYALAAGLTATGADAYLLHTIPTPGVSYLTRAGEFDGGIMISASHNPYLDNGIKLFGKSGAKMEDPVVELLEKWLDGARKPRFSTGKGIGTVMDHGAAHTTYGARLISTAPSLCGLRVGIDAANGAAWHLAGQIFTALGATVHVIHNTPNGVNINDGCGSTHTAELQRLVTEQGLDVGFAFDGDADRCIAVDEHGCVVDGDAILYVMAKAMQARGELAQNTVVTTVMSNFGLHRGLERLGIHTVQTAVGDRFVYERMQKEHYVLGGEQSGHIIFGALADTGDGILTALQVAGVLCDNGCALSDLTAGFVRYPQLLWNVSVRDKKAAVADVAVLQAVAEVERELGDAGRVLVRASGTEPVVRVMVEAETEDRCRHYAERVAQCLGERGHTV